MPSDAEIYFTSGTETTCVAQGIAVIFFGAAITHYYSMLALFAHVAVNCDFNEEKLRRYEPFFHVLSLVLPLNYAIVAAINGHIHGDGTFCTIKPPSCSHTNDNNDCITKSYKILTSVMLGDYLIAWAMSVFFIVSVYKLEKKKIRSNLSLAGKKQFVEDFRKLKAKSVVRQGALYAFSFYTTIFISGITRIAQASTDKYHFELVLLAMISRCMQGIILSVVYDQTRIKELPISDVRTGRQNSSTLVSDIKKRLSTTKIPATQQVKRRRSSKSIQFSIFDGTSPSTVWAEHIYSDDENDIVCGEIPREGDHKISTVSETSEDNVVSVDESFFYSKCNRNICENIPEKV